MEGNEYLLNLSRYVHLNPVRTKAHKHTSAKDRARYLKAYRWSSYRGYIDKRKRWDFVEYEPTLSLLPGPKRGRALTYSQFVETGLAETDDEFAELIRMTKRSIGSKEFRKWVDKEYDELKKACARGEDASFRRDASLFDVEFILNAVAKSFDVGVDALRKTQYKSCARPVAARMLCKYAGMNQRGAADELGYGTGASVSYQLKRLHAVMQEDKRLRKQFARIERQIERG